MLEVFRKDHEDKIKAAEEKEHKRINCEEKRKQREAEKERHRVITEQKCSITLHVNCKIAVFPRTFKYLPWQRRTQRLKSGLNK